MGSKRRQRMDGSLANLLLAGITVLSLLCWGPIPVACLWIGSQANYLSGNVGFGLLVSFGGLFAMLFGALALMQVGWTTHGSSSDVPRGMTSERAHWADLCGHRGRLRAGVRVLVPDHPWARLEHRVR